MFLDTSDANRLRGNNSLSGITSDFQKQMNDLIAPPDQGDAASGMLTAGGPSVSLPSEPAAAPAATAPPAVSPTSPLPDPSQATDSRFPSTDPTEAYVRQSAAKRGIDPDTAVKVYRSEGAGAYVGDSGSSFGPFQLHYGNVAAGGNAVAGLGDEFTRVTGLDARDPKTVNQQIDFALDQVKTQGWTPFHGAARVGVGAQDGIGAVNTQLAQDNPAWRKLAEAQLGKPYIWGSTGGRSDFSDSAAGFDCSGFVSYVYKNALGINLPAQTESAYAATKAVDPKDAQPGDVVLYNMDNPDPHVQHIAIYIGDGKVIQAGGSANSRNVNIAPIATAGTYQFRRADGANTTQANTQAIASVADKAQDAAAQPKSLTDYGSDFAAQLGGLVNGAGQAKDAVVDHVANAATDFQKQLSSILQGAQEASGGTQFNRQAFEQSGITAPSSPLDMLGSSNQGIVPTEGEAVDKARQDFIAQNNPARDVPVVGGATTFAAQAVTDPANLLLMEPAAAKAVATAADALPDAATLLRSRQSAQADANFASGGLGNLLPDSNGSRPLFGRGGVPGGGRKEIPAAAGDTQDLLQQMLDMAKQKKGADDATVQAVQSELDRMRAPAQPAEDKVRQAVDEVRRQGGDPKTLQTIQDGLDDLARTREIPSGPQSGQLPFDDPRFPYESPIPGDVNEARGPRGSESPQQPRLPGDDPLYGDVGGDMSTRTGASAIRPNDRMPSGRQPTQTELFGNDGTNTNPVRLAMEAAAQANPMNKIEKGVSITKGWLLTNPITMGLQVTGGLTETLGRPARAVLTGDVKAAVADVRAMGAHVGDAATNARDAFMYGYRRSKAEMGGKQGTEIAQGPKGLLVTPAYRAMGAIDEFVQTINKAGAEAMAASVESANTGRSAADLLANPTPWMKQISEKAAKASTYEELTGELSQTISQKKTQMLKSGKPVPITMGIVADVIMPFVGIPAVLARRGGRILSDIGGVRGGIESVRTAKGLSSDVKGITVGDRTVGGADAGQRTFMAKQRAGEAMIANAGIAYVGFQAVNGNITGEGPSNWSDEYKKQLEQTIGPDGQPVWKRHSVKVGGRWVDYTNLAGHWAMPMSAVATAVEEYRYSGKQPSPELVEQAGYGALRAVSRQYYLNNLFDIVGLVKDGQFKQAAEKVGSDAATRAIPFSGTASALTRSTDETKQPTNILERVASRVPGVSQLVPDAQDPLGDSRGVGSDLASSLIPGGPTAPRQPTPELKVLSDAGVTVPEPPKEITLPNTGGMNVPLSPDQQRAYQRYYGQALKSSLAPFVEREAEFRETIPLAQRRTLISQFMDSAHSYAVQMTLGTMDPSTTVQPEAPRNLPPVAGR
jgi:cell wall-associated NlpC family hydrolase